MNKKRSALNELHAWMAEAKSFLESASGRSFNRYPGLALGYLQLSAEFTFKAAIVSLTGNTLRCRNNHMLSVRCRRLLPLLRVALIFSPRKQKLFAFLLPAFGPPGVPQPPLPDTAEWKELLQLVRQLQSITRQLCREKIATMNTK